MVSLNWLIVLMCAVQLNYCQNFSVKANFDSNDLELLMHFDDNEGLLESVLAKMLKDKITKKYCQIPSKRTSPKCEHSIAKRQAEEPINIHKNSLADFLTEIVNDYFHIQCVHLLLLRSDFQGKFKIISIFILIAKF